MSSISPQQFPQFGNAALGAPPAFPGAAPDLSALLGPGAGAPPAAAPPAPGMPMFGHGVGENLNTLA